MALFSSGRRTISAGQIRATALEVAGLATGGENVDNCEIARARVHRATHRIFVRIAQGLEDRAAARELTDLCRQRVGDPYLAALVRTLAFRLVKPGDLTLENEPRQRIDVDLVVARIGFEERPARLSDVAYYLWSDTPVHIRNRDACRGERARRPAVQISRKNTAFWGAQARSRLDSCPQSRNKTVCAWLEQSDPPTRIARAAEKHSLV